MKPIIGITTGEIINRDRPWADYVLGQSHAYSDAIVAAGGSPIILPIINDDAAISSQLKILDGILFAGGDDVGPAYYGEEPYDSVENSEARDSYEMKLISQAFARDIPILGICRGMQLINIARGGNMYQDIPTDLPNTLNHHRSSHEKNDAFLSHNLNVLPETVLAKILNKNNIQTNSRHHQAVRSVGAGLKVNAYAEDNIVEGIEDASAKFLVGVQSHPESLFSKAESAWFPLFQAFVKAAAQKVK